MRNSTVFIQEAHNYVDSRASMTIQNRLLTYWILQSRHSGQGTCDIIVDTQEVHQLDIRLRRNIDIVMYPHISSWVIDKITKKKILPIEIIVDYTEQVNQKIVNKRFRFQCKDVMKYYNTHEIIFI